jgi:hypothetical protein
VKLLIKLAIAALLANAGFRIGTEYLTHVKFRDAVRDVATYRSTTNDDLRRRIAGLAQQYGVPQSDDNLTIDRDDRHVTIRGGYDKNIEVLPSYQYPWHFAWELDVIMPASLPYFPPGK